MRKLNAPPQHPTRIRSLLVQSCATGFGKLLSPLTKTRTNKARNSPTGPSHTDLKRQPNCNPGWTRCQAKPARHIHWGHRADGPSSPSFSFRCLLRSHRHRVRAQAFRARVCVERQQLLAAKVTQTRGGRGQVCGSEPQLSGSQAPAADWQQRLFSEDRAAADALGSERNETPPRRHPRHINDGVPAIDSICACDGHVAPTVLRHHARRRLRLRLLAAAGPTCQHSPENAATVRHEEQGCAIV